MPRPIVLGNGSLLLNLDDRGAIRDLFYPLVGKFNHLAGYSIRMGVYAGGSFSWCDGSEWICEQSYVPGSLVAVSRLRRPGLVLELRESVLVESNVFLRQIQIASEREGPIRIFFSQDLRLAETDIGDTAFYNPFLDAVIHYKGPHWILCAGWTDEGGLVEYATGIKAFDGKEGTWRDAEDGHLSMNPIAQGSVDSTFCIQASTVADRPTHASYALVAGADLDEVSGLLATVRGRPVEDVLDEETRRWSAWLPTELDRRLEGLSSGVQALVRQSLAIMTSHVDRGGAVIAATDSDIMATNRATYAYMWPRDGAFVSTIFDEVGLVDISRRFFEFCLRILPRDRPAFLQKYGPDGTVGASWHPWVVDGHAEVPFQEDETALVVLAACRHMARGFHPDLYRDLVRPAARYLMEYRDPQTGLPLPSWDLWEERRGIHTFTVASVAAALRAAAQSAGEAGDDLAHSLEEAAGEVRDALFEHLFDANRGVFFRRLFQSPTGRLEPDRTVDASVLGVARFGLFDPGDPRLETTLSVVVDRLSVRTPVGGLARYEGDYYFRRTDAYPGNPWPICTLWRAQNLLVSSKTSSDLEEPRRILDWVVRRATSTGVLPEQFHPETGEPLSVSPLTWSHAEFVHTAIAFADKARELAPETRKNPDR
ncbi:MAG TPA: glycoside hydrolase family 15 protein [Fimbriimonadaceae bacterium]|nr:glycoside hydrolase family 15 protein [Fimbriimonadaceae bacterium]HRJ96123.1 glycoside hydrolase family 15 protein [Fimbriimonadaceae bacterium]